LGPTCTCTRVFCAGSTGAGRFSITLFGPLSQFIEPSFHFFGQLKLFISFTLKSQAQKGIKAKAIANPSKMIIDN
jgi:hypothetical protein